jgi:translocation and assembly module TamB
MENLEVDLKVDLHRGLQLLASIPTLSDYGQQFAELSSVEVDVELSSPSLGVQSKGSDVLVNGTLEMDRGALDIMGRSFDVGGGSVSFVSDVTDPILDVSATHRTGQYGDITVDVGGSVSDLQLDFSSEQYPDKTDVMAILLLGKPTSEMSSTDGDMGSSLLSAAVGSVASNLSKTVSSSFLGQIEIDADSFKMGFPVGRDIFGTVELRSTEDDDENSIEVTLEWLLSRRLSAELVTGDAAQTSADIYYRWRF